MSRLSGARLVAQDYRLPDDVAAYGNGFNTITATTFSDMPTTACVAAITNPHTSANMIVLVHYAAWLGASANAVRICPRVSGSLTLAAGIGSGGNGPIGWGEIPLSANNSLTQQRQGSATYALPPGTATFTMQAFRDSASGTQISDYPVLRISPLYYVL